ncbi:hypothetical protein ACRALDRAFT_1060678 [Sodiomyces alcalophilus JCM 7366]|uniref:uncharacterized protein n=1 Tax=Sodiomyces alcalophilus JCM 7366 TaxID=591952 RepID=UPI0039B4BBDB
MINLIPNHCDEDARHPAPKHPHPTHQQQPSPAGLVSPPSEMIRDAFAAFRRPRDNDLTELAEKHFEQDLRDSDRDVLRRAAKKVGTHATLGSLVGLGVGLFLAYRLRTSRAQMFQAFRTAEKPTHVQFADGRSKPIPDITPYLKPSTAGDIATYGLLGLGSLFLGGETGFLTGSYSATRSISRDEESRKRIENAFRRYRADFLRKEADRLDGDAKISDMIKFS